MYKMKTSTIFLLIAIVILFFVLISLCKSSFQASTQQMNQSSSDQKVPIKNDDVVIVYAKWCGHCKKAMPEFEKAAKMSDKVILLDEASPSGQLFVKENVISGYPSIIKNGKSLNVSRTAESIVKETE